jgi:CP family cyanate transporter-like MFS transporter
MASHSMSAAWVNRRTVPTLAAAWLSAFNCRAPLVAAGPLLPVIMVSLRLSGAVSGLLTGIPLVLMAALSLPGGMLGDRWGPRWVLALAQFGILLFGVVRAAAVSGTELLLATAGLGAAIGLSQPALAQIAQSMGREQAGEATAVYTTGLMIGSLAATALSVPWLLPWLRSWRGVMLAWAVPAALATILWVALGRRGSRQMARDTDAVRGFVGLHRYPGTLALIVTFAAQSVVFYGLVTWLPAYYLSRGWTLAAASGPETFLSLGSLLGALATPRLLRWGGGIRRPMGGAGAVTALAMAGLLVWPEAGWLWALLAGGATAVAFSLGLAAPALVAEPHETGRLAGTVMAAGYLATVLGPVAVGGLHDLTRAYTPGFLLLFVAALLIMAGTRGLVLEHRPTPAGA